MNRPLVSIVKIKGKSALVFLRTVFCKDRLSVYKIEKKKKKNGFPKLCQNKGLGELLLKISVSFCLELYLFWNNFFKIVPMEAG